MGDSIEEIQAVVCQLKQERETWRTVAQQYKTAFEEQTARLRQLQDICVATQAELENERTSNRQARSDPSLHCGADSAADVVEDTPEDLSFGTATASSSHAQPSWQSVRKSSSLCFHRVEQFADQRDYGTALKEVDHLLRGPLTPETRVEGLILKSNLMRKSEWLYDALAACSEAIELCNHLNELHCYLPQIQYQRGLCYYQLNMLQQARDALSDVVTVNDSLYANAAALRSSCEERLFPGRRPAFEAHRTVTEGMLAQFSENRFDVSCPSIARVVLPTKCHSPGGVEQAHNFGFTHRKQSASLSPRDGWRRGPNPVA
jgi:tetratricopeptide (TPR) repeat protein